MKGISLFKPSKFNEFAKPKNVQCSFPFSIYEFLFISINLLIILTVTVIATYIYNVIYR